MFSPKEGKGQKETNSLLVVEGAELVEKGLELCWHILLHAFQIGTRIERVDIHGGRRQREWTRK
jgi:hypothetical protein